MLIIISVMTCSDQVFHNKYLYNDIFSLGSQRYTDIHNGDLVAKKGLHRLLQLKAEYENDLVFSHKAMDFAAEGCHLHVVQWLHENSEEGCTDNAMDWAAWNGHLHVVQWLHENRTEGCTTFAMDWAAENGHLDTVKWLHENRSEGCTTNAMNYAAMNGHMHVVQWLHENRSELCSRQPVRFTGDRKNCHIDAIDRAIDYGHLDIAEFLTHNLIKN